MSKEPADLEVFVNASARALELPLDAAWKPTVCENLKVIFGHASKVEDFPLPDGAEPAPVFKA